MPGAGFIPPAGGGTSRSAGAPGVAAGAAALPGNGAAVTEAPVQLQTGGGAVRLLPVGEHILATSSDDYLLRMIDARTVIIGTPFEVPVPRNVISKRVRVG